MLVIAAALPALAVSTPSPEDVRECIERNLPRYSTPGSAVTAQYADVEASCQAGLEDGSVSVQFDPGPTDRSDATTTPAAGGAGADRLRAEWRQLEWRQLGRRRRGSRTPGSRAIPQRPSDPAPLPGRRHAPKAAASSRS